MRCALVHARRDSPCEQRAERGAVCAPSARSKSREIGSRCFMIHMRAISDLARPQLAKEVRLQIDSITGKSVLLYPEGILELNETAHDILSRCDGRSVAEIVQGLAEQYEADADALAADVRETLADVHQRKLIEYA